ncbi:glycosyltransferase family 2 protein [Granulosicoccus antarcticus]|uniref:glycosyltransferase family 2 protein n=1 Tax=Granulosicoccus antarcticus TaxID=437505 RepID=UPI000B5A95A7|nr:glycosyltransferase family 2 protein [Granulosicoccus antarcticus]
MNHQYSLSVTIITKNEADRIERCLESVKDLANEIIVFDSGSTDATLDIVRRYTDKIWQTDWPGYGLQKQRALEQAQYDWVLAIDADEALDEELQNSLKEFLSRDRQDVVAVKMKWGVTIYEKRLDYGRSARSPLRMTWREGTFFSNDEVHEKMLHASGRTITLKGRLLHFTHRNYGHAQHKSVEYAWLGSQKYFRKGRRCHSLTGAVLRGLWTFILIFFIRGGFLDGSIGFLTAVSYAQNSFNKYAGLWTLTRMEKIETGRAKR